MAPVRIINVRIIIIIIIYALQSIVGISSQTMHTGKTFSNMLINKMQNIYIYYFIII